MKFLKGFAPCLLALSMLPTLSYAEVYKETFECFFKKGQGKRPTPTRILFSLDEYGRSALLHKVEIPRIDTRKGAAQISRNSYRLLSISWSGEEYRFSEDGRTLNSSSASQETIDLRRQHFSVFLDRTTMKAIARSKSVGNHHKDGNANGYCEARPTPKS